MPSRSDELADPEADTAVSGSRWDAMDEVERPVPRSGAQRRALRESLDGVDVGDVGWGVVGVWMVGWGG